jgi:hypothetical protein
MQFAGLFPLLILTAAVFAQNGPKPESHTESKPVTVPVALDHNRIITNVDLQLPDGSTTRVRGWVDNGNPELQLSRRVATLMGLAVTCSDTSCSAPPPHEIVIGGMKISLAGLKKAMIPLKSATDEAFIAPGLPAEISIPSAVLRNYDVLINYPDHELTIARPGSLKFNGVKTRVIVNAENGLIQVPSQVASKKYNLALDLGESISFLPEELFDKLAAAHPDWPHMAGAVGPANMWGSDDETKWKLMRIDRLQYGPLFLTDVVVVELPTRPVIFRDSRASVALAGSLGANALMNYRVGLDYAHSTVYFDIGRLFNFPEFDVIGLMLRPEGDGRFTILGIADYDGKPSVPGGPDGVQTGDHLVAVDRIPVHGSTMGQVWAMLGGSPGKERVLTVERGRRQFTLVATVQHFLGQTEDKDASKGKPRKNYGTLSSRVPCYCVSFAAPNTSFSSVAVVAESRLSLTSTVSPCCSMTTVPSSVFHKCRPFRTSPLSSGPWAAGWLARASPTSSTFLYRCPSDRA